MSNFVNGSIIQPGATWSMNETAGPRNAQTAQTVGWAKAHVISSGRYEDDYGGGNCQVSGTLYNAAIRAELGIAERRTHSWPSSYVPEGLDATVNYLQGSLTPPATRI
jgi:vancomycin resistance protein YoaR